MTSGMCRKPLMLCMELAGFFTTNTEEGTKAKFSDWHMFLKVVYGGDECVPAIDDVQWSATESAWKSFLLTTRTLISSYKRLVQIVGSVCFIAGRCWHRKLEVHANDVDPRQLYSLEHHRIMGLIRREHGFGVQQVEAITMVEVRNATRFADAESVRGLASCSAFTLAALLGGKRARSLTAVKLGDIKLTASTANLDGKAVLVPALGITFTDEKFADPRGHRQATDMPPREEYANSIWYNNSYWIYRMLVIRGVFVSHDPILSASNGQELVIKPGFLKFYLFCESNANYWIDAAPVHTNTLGNWNRQMLERMGSAPRGFSAHRSGYVGRACVLALLRGKGVALSSDTVDVIARLGGWSSFGGNQTVMEVYARRDIDIFADPYSLTMGVDVSSAEWEQRRLEYIGQIMQPAVPTVDVGRTMLPLQWRRLTWRSPIWIAFQSALNDVVACIMTASNHNEGIMPINRFRRT